jgi:hypothetical protein
MAFSLSSLSGIGNGLLTGSFVGPTFLPMNDLIREYGLENGSLFRVKMSAFKNTQVTLSTKEGGPFIKSKPPTQPLFEAEVLHNEKSLSMNHQHNWGQSQGLIGQAQKAMEKGFLGMKGDTIINALKGATDLVQRDQTNVINEFNTWGSFDVAEVYQGNSAPSFKVKFALIASKDPLIEVVIPSLIFTYFSYPSLSKEKDIGNMVGAIKKMGQGAAGVLGFGDSSGKKSATTIVDKAQRTLEDTWKAIKDVSAGKWRYRVGDAPPFWMVSSSNGLIHLPNCHISNIDVNYFGPWVEAPEEKSVLEAVSGLASSSGLTPEMVFPNSSLIGSFGTNSNSGLGGYPTYATVEITFKHAFTKIFGEEFLLSMGGSSSHFGGKSTASIF